MLTPDNWYIVQRNGLFHLCHSDGAMTCIRNYKVNSNMWLSVYDDNEEYVLEPARQDPNHQTRTYSFTISLCVWNIPQRLQPSL